MLSIIDVLSHKSLTVNRELLTPETIIQGLCQGIGLAWT
ncbi:hypothetical protein SHDE107825_19305 [Shewanella denitrificans]